MDLGSAIISALLFAAFVPGVLLRFPKGSPFLTVVATHAILFAVVTSIVMRLYWTKIKGYVERFGNYGPTCPNGYVPGVNQGGKPDCVPAGQGTYPGTAK